MIDKKSVLWRKPAKIHSLKLIPHFQNIFKLLYPIKTKKQKKTQHPQMISIFLVNK